MTASMRSTPSWSTCARSSTPPIMVVFPPRMNGMRTSSRRRPNGWACSDCGTVRSLWNCPNAGSTPTTVLVFAVLGVVWRAGRRLALRATHRIPRDAQPLLEDTKFVICLALVGGFGLLLTLNPGLLVLPKDTTFTEQVARQAGLEALSCPTILDSKYMPGQGRYECEYVDAKGQAHDMSLLVAFGDRVWLYDHNGKTMKVTTK